MKQQFPEPTCGALIFNSKGEMLLVKSHKWKNKYVMPGGHVELGETIEDALKREIMEETGMRIYDIEYLMHQEFIYGKEFYKKKHFIFFDFYCKTKSKKVILNNEGQEYKWVKLKDALKMPVEPYTIKTIKEYLKLK